jgi:methyl-accepting chemotaxis protein
MKDSLNLWRDTVSKWLVLFLWLHVPLIAVVAWAAGNGWVAPSVMAAVFAMAATASWKLALSAKSTRLTVAAALVALVSVLLAVARGTGYQLDIHMYYFAALAILATYCDREVILLGAGIIALHHLTLNFIAPYLVFPGGADFARVVLHAVIVVIEAGALYWMAHRITASFALAAKNLADAQAASAAAAALEAAAEAQRRVVEAERQAAFDLRVAAAAQQAKVVEALGRGLEKVAKGDLVFRLTDAFPEEFRKLQTDFNEAMEALRRAIHGVAGSSGDIQRNTLEIMEASEDLSRRTEEQAAALHETVTAVGEITETVRRTAAGASEAKSIVVAARADAQASDEIVRETIGAMRTIEASSGQIASIVGVIDDIAFQTNLLALNAGVEAARAGDAGRGFAVVATEVRALAQRSAAAAKEIKALISGSGAQVAAGVRLVRETGAALTKTVEQVSKLNQLFDQIAAAAQDQANGLNEVNAAMGRMDQVTQQNALMVQRTQAAADTLVQAADALAGQVARFQTADETPAPPRAPGFEPLRLVT